MELRRQVPSICEKWQNEITEAVVKGILRECTAARRCTQIQERWDGENPFQLYINKKHEQEKNTTHMTQLSLVSYKDKEGAGRQGE